MKEFFVIVNEQQQGPFTIEQLAEMAITPETEVWTAGMADWQQAGDVPELTSLLQQLQFQQHMGQAPATPPPHAAQAPAQPAPVGQSPAQSQPWEQPQAATDDGSVSRPVKQRNGCGVKLLLATLILVIVLGVLAVTCPSRQEHKDAISQSTHQWVNEKMAAVDEQWGGLASVLTGAIEWVSGQGIDFVVDQYLDVDNYGVCSVGRINVGDKSKIVSLGVLNHIFTFDKDDVDRFMVNALKNQIGMGEAPAIAPRHDEPTVSEDPASDEDDSYLATPEEQDSAVEPQRQPNPAEELLDSIVAQGKRQVVKTAKEWAKKQIDRIGD